MVFLKCNNFIGHQDQWYAHLRDETLKQASNLMGELVEQAINTEKKSTKTG
ncbi:hypothetical protein ACFL55_03040 [Candidatus Latescibacterota bacterium]